MLLSTVVTTAPTVAQEVTTIISTVGFPIVMCLLMYKMNDDQDKRHREEVDKITEALNNNTLVIQKLVDNLDK